MIRIVNVITGLPAGGAQTMLYKLLAAAKRDEIEPEVVSLLDRGSMGERIEKLGIRVRALHAAPGPSILVGAIRLARWLREDRPDIVQCWMYHADLVGGVAARLAGVRRVIWGLRQSAPDPPGTKRSTVLVARACARLSRHVPRRIVCCSEAARREHTAFGYDPTGMVVIPNGFDLEAFRPDASPAADVRRELGLPQAARLVALVARFHAHKDHPNFLEAARQLADALPDVHFLLCGENVDVANRALSDWVSSLGLAGRLHLLGERRDVPDLLRAIDLACSSSFAEGFPNALGEAMACGVPCVATDVGECAELVGDTGRVVPPRDPEALAGAMRELLDLPPAARRRLGAAARRRIEERYALAVVAERYHQLYREVLDS